MSENTANVQRKDFWEAWGTFKIEKSGSLEAKYREIKGILTVLHSTVH